MIRVNPTTQQPEVFPSHYDAERQAIVAQTISLSMWFGTLVTPGPTDWGCVHIENLSLHTWFTFCVDSFTLKYPAQDLQYMPQYGMGGLWAPVGHIGISNESNYRLPQGSYWICTQFGDEFNPNEYTRGRDSFIVADPWNESQPEESLFAIHYRCRRRSGHRSLRLQSDAHPARRNRSRAGHSDVVRRKCARPRSVGD